MRVKTFVNSQSLVIIIALLFGWSLLLLRGQALLQFEIVTLATLIYLSWAFLHHHFNKSLTVEVIIEYILIAALILIMSEGLV